jgi:hypothetical protein
VDSDEQKEKFLFSLSYVKTIGYAKKDLLMTARDVLQYQVGEYTSD